MERTMHATAQILHSTPIEDAFVTATAVVAAAIFPVLLHNISPSPMQCTPPRHQHSPCKG